jgi:predicted DNA-binding helix-hairpin-helix protein
MAEAGGCFYLTIAFGKHLFYNVYMDAVEKLGLLSAGACDEVAEEAYLSQPMLRQLPQCGSSLDEKATHSPFCKVRNSQDIPVVHSSLPGGGTITLLKTLQTSVCENDCYYCCFRRGRDFQRTTLTPDEMATAFMQLYRSRRVEGLFLSSGVAGGGIRTQDRLIATAEILRNKLGFRGYIHLKIMPGCERDQVLRGMQLADRVSINLEAPNTERLSRLAPAKVFLEQLLQPLIWVDQIRKDLPSQLGWKGRWPSTTTQFVVGAVGESDLELLTTTAYLHSQVHLARAYYSGFSPVKDTPLENQTRINPWRQNRLYQASFLLRDYGFDLEELPFVQEGNLPLGTDPKLAWAQLNLGEKPVDVNKAEMRDLLRVPGIGPKTAQAILDARCTGRLRQIGDLRRLGVATNRAAPFILLDGFRPARQMALF